MIDLHIIQKTSESANQYSWWHMTFAVIVAALTGGFFNPTLKWVVSKISKKKKKHEGATDADAAIKVAEIKKEEKTEGKLWERVESLENKLNEEVQKRIDSEKTQGELQRQVDELKRERLFTLTRYIHLKLRIEEAKKEIEYLKSKLREKDPEFDKDYPTFTVDSETMADEKLIAEIIKEFPENSSPEVTNG